MNVITSATSARANSPGRASHPLWWITVATGALVVIIALAALIAWLAFPGADARRAITASATLAYLVQIAAFAIVWRLRRWNVIGAWGLGVILRFATLAVYALVVVRMLSLQPAPALFSLVTFFFVTTLAEPWLLRP